MNLVLDWVILVGLIFLIGANGVLKSKYVSVNFRSIGLRIFIGRVLCVILVRPCS